MSLGTTFLFAEGLCDGVISRGALVHQFTHPARHESLTLHVSKVRIQFRRVAITAELRRPYRDCSNRSRLSANEFRVSVFGHFYIFRIAVLAFRTAVAVLSHLRSNTLAARFRDEIALRRLDLGDIASVCQAIARIVERALWQSGRDFPFLRPHAVRSAIERVQRPLV